MHILFDGEFIMRKCMISVILFAVICAVLSSSVLAEVAVQDYAHSHIAQGKWKKDSISHWKLCSCGEKVGKEPHFDEDGNKICDVCPYSMDAIGVLLDFSSSVVEPGETVSVDITLSGNPGIAGLDIKLDFDRENLKIKEIIYDNWKATDNLAFCGDGRSLSLLFYRTSNVYVNGVLATLVFEVSEDAPVGKYPVEITFVEATNEDTGDVYMTVHEAKICVGCNAVGDVDSDGEIDIRDCIAMAQYLAGWEVSINRESTDCNSDGEVTIKDIILLAQYLAGWSVSLG